MSYKKNENDQSHEQVESELTHETNCNEFPKKFLRTLPRTFKCLLDTSINVENDKPRDLIRLLGELLEITDYATNMASFWFLDTLALYMLRYKDELDEYYMAVLISWLTGEMKLLRDKKYTRKEFFQEMKNIFIVVGNKISQQNRIPYWEEIVYEMKEEMEENESMNESKSLQESISQEDMKFLSNIDPLLVLDIIIDATYDMYANELRYALIYAVFIEPIEVQTYNLPFTFRHPRRIKPAEYRIIPFNIQLQKLLRKNELLQKLKKLEKNKKAKLHEVPPTPPPSLDDEIQLKCNRLFILPLIEANEASYYFDTNSHNAQH